MTDTDKMPYDKHDAQSVIQIYQEMVRHYSAYKDWRAKRKLPFRSFDNWLDRRLG